MLFVFFPFGFRLFSVWFIQGYMLFFNASGCSFSPITHRFWDRVGWTFLFGDLAVLSLLYSPTLKPSVLSTLYVPLLSEFIKAPKLHIIWAFKTWVKLCQWWFGRCVKKWRCSRAQRTFFKQQVPSPYNPEAYIQVLSCLSSAFFLQMDFKLYLLDTTRETSRQ